ncbi:hypothetical protein [Butyrivibrio fibrisolvens]|uniref:hypothetical protein n=1 Tax=Butyrivibrio fibrisolvens TaxID=831 RepID=UPI00041E2884|nr:hypothetical protein [Butyrivibrio fibrisolvens]
MALTITERDKALLMIFGGVVIAGLTYYYGYYGLNEKTKVIEDENVTLSNQVQLLTTVSANKDTYVNDTDRYILNTNKIMAGYPSYVTTADKIMYTELLTNILVPTYTYEAVLNKPVAMDIMIPEREDQLSGAGADVTGLIALNQYESDGTIPDVTGLMFYDSVEVMTFDTTYNGLKQIILNVVNNEDFKNVTELNVSYDSSTGRLSGDMTIDYYYLEGTDKEYTFPSPGLINHGTDNIFGDVTDIQSSGQ